MFSQISEAHHADSYVEASEGKPENNQLTRQDGVGCRVGATCCPDKVGSFGCALHGALEGLVLLGVGHTGRSVVRRPRASYGWRSAVRTSFVRTEFKIVRLLAKNTLSAYPYLNKRFEIHNDFSEF